MSKRPVPPLPSQRIGDGYQPTGITNGYQPSSISAPLKPLGGHQPTTGQGPSSAPPNQGSGGKK